MGVTAGDGGYQDADGYRRLPDRHDGNPTTPLAAVIA